MGRKSSLILFSTYLFITWVPSHSQTLDFGFIEHIESIGEYSEGILYLDQFEDVSDSAFYYRGRFLYHLKEMEKSIEAFSKVPLSNKTLGPSSRFYEGIQLTYLGQYDQAYMRLIEMDDLEKGPQELRTLELAGISLLQRDLIRFDSLSGAYDSDFSLLKEHQDALVSIKNDWVSHKDKSPALAGILSAIIPGSGKCYVGRVGEGIMSLATTGIFALQAWEGYRKDGPGSVRFITFSTIFGVFYTANIWGTVVSVQMEKERFTKKTNESILVNMHIPLRIFYK